MMVDKGDVVGSVCETSTMMVKVCRLHLENKTATLDVCILWIEDAAVTIEGTANLVPARLIKEVEIVLPGKLKVPLVLVIIVHLNVVEKKVPGHVTRVEVRSPRVERWGPEV